MKRTAAILFLTIQLFCLVGKVLLVDFFIQRNSLRSIIQIDQGDYDRSDLVEMKVPLKLPYYSSSSRFERYYGEVNIEGQYYNYVMRKVIGDTVYLVCLANNTKSTLKKAQIEFASNTGDANQAPVKKGVESVTKKQSVGIDYFQQIGLLNFQPAVTISIVREFFYSDNLPFCITGTADRPPELSKVNKVFATASALLNV